MEGLFPGYYRPTDEDFKVLWSRATLVLDTNVLLHLYQVPRRTREDLLGLLSELNERIWIPHHVALEFQRRRLGVIAAQQKATKEALASSSKSISDVRQQIQRLELEKWGREGFDSKPMLEALASAESAMERASSHVQTDQLRASHDDEIRERLGTILAGRIGSSPRSQVDIDDLARDGDLRYSLGIPPGFLDADKDKDPKEARFVHDGLVYQRKFGDLISWRQFLAYAKSLEIKEAIFVTSDTKKDWWLYEGSDRIGPHPELVSEAQREGGIASFWMYTLAGFLKHSESLNAKTKISHQAVADVSAAENRPPDFSSDVLFTHRHSEDAFTSYAVRVWLEQNGHSTIAVANFGLVILREREATTVLIVRVVSSAEAVFSDQVFSMIAQARARGATSLAIVFVISSEEYARINADQSGYEDLSRLRFAAKRCGAEFLAAGAVVNGRFYPLSHSLPNDGFIDPGSLVAPG